MVRDTRDTPNHQAGQAAGDAILDVSRRGEIVLDPFLGSGSTLIACERVGRVCHGIELDPAYVDTALRRWRNYTGVEPVQAASGLTLRWLEAQRKPPAADARAGAISR